MKKIIYTSLIFLLFTSFTLPALYIHIEKAKRKISLIKAGVVTHTYSMVLGFDPVGDKMQEGDGRTPEGWFKIRDQYPHKSWSKFIWIDYPNSNSKLNFSNRKKQKIIDASAKIGGDVGIHGVPVGRDDMIERKIDWTLGCISLKNDDINELYGLVKPGTSIFIEP
jgi:murein L,D-transpeptidase YafK